MSQRHEALETANARRMEIVAIRRAVLARTISIPDLFLDPPESLQNLSLIEIHAMARASSKRASSWRTEIGRRAVRDGVNLLQPLRGASSRSREWCAENAVRVQVSRPAREKATA